jgi:hypothetical protein
MHPHQDLTALGRRLGDLDDFEHFGAAEALELDGFHD